MSLAALEPMLHNCTRCSNCKWSPAVRSERFASICPSIRYGRFHPYSGGGKLISAAALLQGRIDYDDAYIEQLYACSMCGGCDTACKTHFGEMVEPLTSLYAIREQAWKDGKTPEALQAVVRALERYGNAAGLPAAKRGEWCAGLSLARPARPEVLLHAGEAAFDPAQWPALHYVVQQLRSAGVPFVIGGEAEPDCGGLAFDIGTRETALALARRTADWVCESGASTLVTCSDHAYSAMKSIYPRLGVSLGEVEVLHVSQWLARRSAAHPPIAADPEPVTYHDGCRLGRLGESFRPWNGEWKLVFNAVPVRADGILTSCGVGGVYDEPRLLLERAGAQVIEMERNREFAFCAGAGAGAARAYPEFAKAAGLERLDEALATGARTLVSGCDACTAHLQRLAQSESLPIRVMGLLEYLRSREAQP